MPQARDGKLCRVRLEQGHITQPQLRLLAKMAECYGNGVIELTSRANIQLRGIRPISMASLIKTLGEAGLAPKTPAGDGVRNIMVNPTAGFDMMGDKQILPLAQHLSILLQTNPRYQRLSPKFSIFLDGGEACARLNHVSDIWLSLCDGGQNFAFGLASRPPIEGETEAATEPALGKIPSSKAKDFVLTLIDILLAYRDQQPEIDRMKHLIEAHNIRNILRQKCSLIRDAEDFRRPAPTPHSHLGIHPMRVPQRFYLGLKPPLGRLTPAMARFVCENADTHHLRLTPWQSLILPNLGHEAATQQQHIFAEHGFVTSASEALADIVCCVGNSGCQAAKAQCRTDAQHLAQALKGKNFGSIHLSGCAKSCAANEALTTTLLAQGEGHYHLFRKDKKASSPFGQLIAASVSIEQAAEKIMQISTQNPA